MQESGYNKIEIRTTSSENELIYYRPGVGIQVLVDGVVFIDGDDYYLDIETFFGALSEQKSAIEVIGGCHERGCCANGAWTELTAEAWVWKPIGIRLNWADVYQVGKSMIDIIDDCTSRGEPVWSVMPGRIEFYRKQLEYAEAWSKMC